MIILVDSLNPHESVVTRTNPTTGMTATRHISAPAAELIRWLESDINSDVPNPNVPPADLEFMSFNQAAEHVISG